MNDESGKKEFIEFLVNDLSLYLSSKDALLFGYILGKKFDKLEKSNIYKRLIQVKFI